MEENEIEKEVREEEEPTEETAVTQAEYGDVYEEEFSTFSDAQELIGADEKRVHGEEVGSYGDFIVEEFSVESNVKKVVKYVKMPEKVAQYLFALLYLTVGVLCAVMPHNIEFALPYIVGGGLGAMSLIRFIFAIVTKEYRETHTNKTATSLVMMGLSVMIILEHEWAHTFIPIVWGILGLFEGAHAFNHALSRISRGLRCEYYIIKGIVELAVAFLLLYKPEQYGELHIIVFGISLILDGITTLPFIKNFVTRR